jgi:hypothetical protein
MVVRNMVWIKGEGEKCDFKEMKMRDESER